MRYVVYKGARARNPEQAARIVAEDGTAWHVLRVEDHDQAERKASDRNGSVHEDQMTAFLDALRRYDGSR